MNDCHRCRTLTERVLRGTELYSVIPLHITSGKNLKLSTQMEFAGEKASHHYAFSE